jgi:hypothetical protein
LSHVYGLALPLVKRGLPVEPVQIESATAPGFLKPYRLLLLTYEGQKPPTPEFHKALAQWVREGGALVVVDDDGDPYCAVREWWNAAPLAYRSPRQHLFETLGLAPDAVGIHRVGRGVLVREPASPAALANIADGADRVRNLARKAARAVKLEWKETNALVLRRGPYVIAAGLDESVPNAAPFTLRGRFINLFDSGLPVEEEVTLTPGKRAFLFDLAAAGTPAAKVAAAACRIRDERADKDGLHFQAEGIADTLAAVRVAIQAPPARVLIDGKPSPAKVG